MNPRTWTVRVNIDRTGGPQNWAVTAYENGEPVAEYVSPDAGPFDSVTDAWLSALAYIERNYGRQLSLWE